MGGIELDAQRSRAEAETPVALDEVDHALSVRATGTFRSAGHGVAAGMDGSRTHRRPLGATGHWF